MTLTVEHPEPPGLNFNVTHIQRLSDNRLSGNTLTQPTSTESRWPSTVALAVRAVLCLSDLLKAAELSVTVLATTY